MKFSVVIVNYDSWPHTMKCVESLHATGYEDFEVVVVDNDRRDVPEIPYPIRLFRNPVNVGFARAHNQGAHVSGGEYVVHLNPDVLVERNFFDGLERFFREYQKAGIAGPRITDSNGELQLSARREVSFVSGLLGRTSLLTRVFPKSKPVMKLFPAAEEHTGPTRVDWVSGACVVIRRETAEDIGPFDERFFMYFEDADLCRRAREAGWHVYYLPRIEVVHHTGGSSRSKPRAIWLLHKSAFLYHRKHGPHGPFNLYSALILVGLAGRAIVKLVSNSASRHFSKDKS